MASLRSRIESDLLALGALSFMAGSLATTAWVLVGRGLLGWIYALRRWRDLRRAPDNLENIVTFLCR
jgi:hypothetical protein